MKYEKCSFKMTGKRKCLIKGEFKFVTLHVVFNMFCCGQTHVVFFVKMSTESDTFIQNEICCLSNVREV